MHDLELLKSANLSIGLLAGLCYLSVASVCHSSPSPGEAQAALMAGAVDDEDESSGTTGFLIAAGHIVVIALLLRWCLSCCKKEERQEAVEETSAYSELQEQKRLSTGYVLWLFGGWVGAHHFYYSRFVHGLAATWTLNFLLVGRALIKLTDLLRQNCQAPLALSP